MTEGLALSVCPGCSGARRSAGRQLCLLITAENIRSPWGGQKGRGVYCTARHFPLCLYLCSLDKEQALAGSSTSMFIMYVHECMCVCVCEREENNKGVEWEEDKFGYKDLEYKWKILPMRAQNTHTGRKNRLRRFFLNLIWLIAEKHSSAGNHQTSQCQSISLMSVSPFIPLSSSLPLIHLSRRGTAEALCSDRNKWSLITTRRPCSTMTEHFHSLPELCVCCARPTNPSWTPHVALEECWPFLKSPWKKYGTFLNCITSGWSIFPPPVSQNSKVSFSKRSVRWKANKSVGR